MRRLFTLVVPTLFLSLVVSASSKPRTPLKFDEFGRMSCRDEQARLDNYGQVLQRSAGVAVIIVYAGVRDTRVGEVTARLFGMRDRLVRASSIDINRIVILDGGVREKLHVQFYIIPSDVRDSASTLFDFWTPQEDPQLRVPRVEKWDYECRRASKSHRYTNKRVAS